MQDINHFIKSRRIRQITYLMALIPLTLLLVFLIYYRTTGYNTLKDWYLSLNTCIYNGDVWTSKFFTPQVKEQGDQLAIVGIALAILLASYFIYRIFVVGNPVPLSEKSGSKNNKYWTTAVLGCGLILTIGSYLNLSADVDEIFSAVWCADTHPIQTMSYYMLPNNHVFFNFANHILFWWMRDYVLSGRLISMGAYLACILFIFKFLKSLFPNILLVFFTTIVVATQFTALGFSSQARGYELQLLCAWVALVSQYRYYTTNDVKHLRTNALFNILGFLVLITHTYCFVAQSIIFLLMSVVKKKIEWTYIKYQLLTVSIVFLCYLPAFSFSGIDAFANNPYIKPAFPNIKAFWPTFLDVTGIYINFVLYKLGGEKNPINFILFALPLLLFFSRKFENRLLGLYWLILWLVYAVITLNMRRYPFCRNMIFHYSFSLALMCYTVFLFVERFTTLINSEPIRRKIARICYLTPIACLTIYFIKSQKEEANFWLYFNDANVIYREISGDAKFASPGSTVACSNESFLIFYIWRKAGIITVKCPSGTEDYYVKLENETLPATMVNTYRLERKMTENFELWKKASK